MVIQRPTSYVLIKPRAGGIRGKAVLWSQAAPFLPSKLSPRSIFHIFKSCGGEFHTRNSHTRATLGEPTGYGDLEMGDLSLISSPNPFFRYVLTRTLLTLSLGNSPKGPAFQCRVLIKCLTLLSL